MRYCSVPVQALTEALGLNREDLSYLGKLLIA
jgi:hypothetical protein